jgi:hypothetical protein
MFMAVHASRKYLPWLVAWFAAALTVGIGVLAS